MSETSSNADVMNTTDAATMQSYARIRNLGSSEFPVTITVAGIDTIVPPLTITVNTNGDYPIGTPTDASLDRRWVHIEIANPDDTAPPLTVDTMVLNPNEVEPSIPISTQYIRVVIRNYTIPQGEKPAK